MHDLDKGFPLIADRIDDVRIEEGKVSFIFFGAAGDLNTNRQSRRIVDLYKRYKDAAVKFIVLDVDNARTSEAKQLIKSYYQGYIPGEVVLNRQGKAVWTHVGETDLQTMVAQLDKALEVR